MAFLPRLTEVQPHLYGYYIVKFIRRNINTTLPFFVVVVCRWDIYRKKKKRRAACFRRGNGSYIFMCVCIVYYKGPFFFYACIKRVGKIVFYSVRVYYIVYPL